MRPPKNISEREHQRRERQSARDQHEFHDRRAFGVDEFCARNDVSRSFFYTEVRAGRLIVRKAGRKTLVTYEDEAAWLASLPVLQTKEAA